MKRKIINIILVSVMTGALLTGCGNNEEKKEIESSNVESTLANNENDDESSDQSSQNVVADNTEKIEDTTQKTDSDQPTKSEDVATTEKADSTEKNEQTTEKDTSNKAENEKPSKDTESSDQPTKDKTPADNTQAAHKHNYSSSITKESTCTEKGVKTYTCSCGDSYTEEIAKTGHTESGWVTVTEATCSSDGLKHKTCTVCGVETASETIISNGSHNYYWDGNNSTRTHKCSGCSYVGITEYNINGAWGYYDDNAAATLWNYINNQRNKTTTNTEDDWGNATGVISVPSLILSNELNSKAKTRAAEAAINFSHGSNTDECLAWGQGSPEAAMDAWGGSYAHMKALTNPEYVYGGITCFYFDSDNSGFNLTPIWVLELGR